MILLYVWLHNENHISENPKSENTYCCFPLLMTTKNLQNHFFYAFWPYVTSQKKKASPHPSTHKTDKNGLNNVIGHLNLTSWVNHYNWSIEKSFPLLVFLQSTANMVIKQIYTICAWYLSKIYWKRTLSFCRWACSKGTIAIGICQRYQKFEIITAPVRGKSNILPTRIILLEEIS